VGDGVGSSVVGSGVGAGVAGSGVLSISVVVGGNVFCVHALTTCVSLVRSAMDDTPRMMIDRCNMVCDDILLDCYNEGNDNYLSREMKCYRGMDVASRHRRSIVPSFMEKQTSQIHR